MNFRLELLPVCYFCILLAYHTYGIPRVLDPNHTHFQPNMQYTPQPGRSGPLPCPAQHAVYSTSWDQGHSHIMQYTQQMTKLSQGGNSLKPTDNYRHLQQTGRRRTSCTHHLFLSRDSFFSDSIPWKNKVTFCDGECTHSTSAS